MTVPRTDHLPTRARAFALAARLLVALLCSAPAILCSSSYGSAAQQYTWTDEQGFHIADSLEKVPEKHRPKVLPPKPAEKPKKEGGGEGEPVKATPAGGEARTAPGRPEHTPATPTRGPAAEAAEQVEAVRESWEPLGWIPRGRSALLGILLLGLAIHGASGLVQLKRSRALGRALDLYEKYLATRDRKDVDLGVVLAVEEGMEQTRRLVRRCRLGTSKVRITEEAPAGAGRATSGVVDVISGSLSRSGAVTESFRSLLRQALGAARYSARRALHPLALADLAVHLPRHLVTGFGTRRVRSERWMRLLELLYWVFAVVCLSVWV